MALAISKIINTNIDPRLVSGFKLPKNTNTPTPPAKIDLCTLPDMSGLLGTINLPDLSLPNIDLPKFNFLNNFDVNLPDFTKFKIDGLKLSGLYNPFKCNLGNMSLPYGKSLAYQSTFNKLGNINCSDKGEAANDNKLKNLTLLNALNSGNCAKVAEKVVKEVASDLSILGVNTDSVTKGMMNTVVKSVVDNKFDIGEASKLLTGNNTVGMITSNLNTSSTPLDRLIKVSKISKIASDKNPIIDYATRISNNKSLSDNVYSPIMNLAKSASKDTSSNITSLPATKTLTNSQSLALFGKAKSLVHSNKILDIKKMIA